MSTWDKRYTDRVQLLVDILPTLAKETRFALKGGTAINLFEHDLPRLSVDIDLTWLPMQDFAQDVTQISDALRQLAQLLSAPPLKLQVQTSASEKGGFINRLIASRGRTRVQIETTPVMRGTVHPVRMMTVQPQVEEAFGFASAQVLDFADLYAGKMAAALSRQHPRDLFDIGLLLADHRADERLWRTFLVYMTCSPKPAWEMLVPNEPKDFEAIYEAHFKGMTAVPTSAEMLLGYRASLLRRIAEWFTPESKEFLKSVEMEEPDFNLIALPQAAGMPAVKRKLQNLAARSGSKRTADLAQLVEAIETIEKG
ncbi:nucleotidyl transferase AbiEii/AbiGii toxin family protein [Pseudomonas anguilliseptica]|uniref:nucleotidyl transferase AbiEii/AbiGii toxin family protein n=1 Tax=Pseudomonas anguilliseptica TaxID=53406 RepID=UPI0022AE831B|nr:nucleotidyl transferase AbiEii/AbiGii toxin family protein [Pseudomonas anguilliseptica]MCZ4323225.1 nucleotidyl transferase AbiEii/AbiGii toxin family protein [Pseudomonas anguilliseptica]